MAHQPTDPKPLQAMQRIVTVLRLIEAGAEYFYTPHAVDMGYNHMERAEGQPYYVVYRGDPAGSSRYAGENQWDEDFNITIEGVVHNETDTVAALERAVADVRKAINEDSKNKVSGALGDGVLCVDTRFELPPIAELGIGADLNFGYFKLNCRVIISGDYGEI